MAESFVRDSHGTALQPRVELIDALQRCRQSLSYKAPELKDISIAVLCEYAAGRLLRDCVPSPQRIVRDLRRNLADRQAWWEEWQNRER